MCSGCGLYCSFNPKREARPSQTTDARHLRTFSEWFQSQTGSQALSDGASQAGYRMVRQVSIPNGKPGPLRRNRPSGRQRRHGCFNPKREARPSQTVTRSTLLQFQEPVSIPNGKPGPLRRNSTAAGMRLIKCFNPKREARPSQTQPAP